MLSPRELSVMTAADVSSILVYSVLGLCMVMVITSLCIAFAVFPRRSKDKPSKPGAKKAKHQQECVVKLGAEVGQPHSRQSSNG